MDLEVVGRHALLFDDDATLAFVNSKEALVPWNVNSSLLIDRYDVRNLLQEIPSARLRKQQQESFSQLGFYDGDGVSQLELDRERYLDLPEDENFDEGGDSFSEANKGAEMAGHGSYQAVPFAYGNPTVMGDLKNSEVGFNISGYRPPFSLPESVLNNLPPTEKVHQIIARTALFVSENGGQSEIVLRVKQGDNPTFGFLMPDHHLHAYFRFLVDHPELVKVEVHTNDKQEEKADSGENDTHVSGGGALSLLGSMYSSGEDDEGEYQAASKSEEMETGISDEAVVAAFQNRSRQEASSTHTVEAKTAIKHPSAVNEKAPPLKKSYSVSAASASITHSKTRAADTNSINVAKDKTQPSSSDLILEPPSSLKRAVDKIVEFIIRNGKEFETVLIEQDRMNGKFPFLLQSNQYHSYYLKVLHEASKPKKLGKNPLEKNHDTSKDAGRTRNIHETLLKGPDTCVQSTAGQSEGLYDPERREKFKMVIAGAKKETHDPPPKPSSKQSGMSADAAAAIVMAATRGLSFPTQLESPPKISTTDSGIALTNGEASFSSYVSTKPISNGKSDTSKSIQPSKHKVQSTASDVSIANAIAKTAARATASEADSSEACLTREQKQKAERLRRAKMFAAMIKSGQHNSTFIGNSGSHGGSMSDLMGREREGSSVPVGAETSDKVDKDKSGEKQNDPVNYPSGVDKSRKRRISRSRDHDENSEEDHKHSRKKHHSEHSSKYKHRSPSEDEHRHRKKSKSRNHHRHHSSDDDDDDGEHHGHRSSHRHRRKSKSHSERKPEVVVNGKGNAVASDQKDVSLNVYDLQEMAMPSVLESQPSNGTEVSDELRAKVRAMLLATM